ncbi:TetR/AcrR family transcriptional regulator [Paenibacillus sp. JCM 10914]|uniref:TetR/AcrR family transcriptional regulator n=1 Tax=Paenibacillus sp. JCM 10914 TaxID=1236974 RepID=UPI000691F85E|nr:TetR/AcrR family transcriptional regulator [Paenibacillus sp. JCM 10914]
MTTTPSHNPNDPRVIRTRQLILDAFMYMLNKKDFNSITISDLTKVATINRATFYSHFPDKFGLLDALLSDAFMDYVHRRVPENAILTEETVKNLIHSLCDYHESSSKQCVRNYESVAPLVEKNIIVELEKFVLQLLSKTYAQEDGRSLEQAATIISWSIYEITYRWFIKGKIETPIELFHNIAPFFSFWIVSEAN